MRGRLLTHLHHFSRRYAHLVRIRWTVDKHGSDQEPCLHGLGQLASDLLGLQLDVDLLSISLLLRVRKLDVGFEILRCRIVPHEQLCLARLAFLHLGIELVDVSALSLSDVYQLVNELSSSDHLQNV